jgi:hypothetical protein
VYRKKAAVSAGAAVTAAALLPGAIAVVLPTARPAAAAGAALRAPGAAADFTRGAIYGKVVDAETNKPIANAMVAIQDRNGKTISWTRTDAEGAYALAAETLKVLQLEPKRRRGLLSQIAGGLGKAVSIPVQVMGRAANSAVDVVTSIDPVGAVRAALALAVTASTVPTADAVGDSAKRAVEEDAQKRLTEGRAALEGAKGTSKDGIARSIVSGKDAAPPKDARLDLLPGEIFVAVSAPGYQDVRGKAGAYWLEPRETKDGKTTAGPQAWLETARLARQGADPKKFKSAIDDMNVLLTDPVIDSTLVPAGSPALIGVRVRMPGEQKLPVRVFARERKTGTTVEMRTQGDDGIYAAYLVLDAKAPIGDSAISIVAVRADPVDVSLKESKTQDPMLVTVRESDALKDDKKFDADPRFFAAPNRIDIAITVLDPARATPASPVPAPASR